MTAPAQAAFWPVRSTLAPPLAWAGGKRWLVPELRRLWQRAGMPVLVEPFVGGASVALGLATPTAILNDANPLLINFYRSIQHGFVITRPLRDDAVSYYSARAELNALLAAGDATGHTAAVLFYYLNRTAFNGLWRVNPHTGAYNVPYGSGGASFIADWAPYVAQFAGWSLHCGDFAEVPCPPGAFLYADPPYDSTFTGYTADRFDWSDQQRLARWLSAHDGPAVASNAATERVLALYRELGWTIQIRHVPRRINSDGAGRGAVREMLAWRGVPDAFAL